MSSIVLELAFMILTIVSWHEWNRWLCVPFFLAYLYFRWKANRPKPNHKIEKLDLSGLKKPSRVTFNKE